MNNKSVIFQMRTSRISVGIELKYTELNKALESDTPAFTCWWTGSHRIAQKGFFYEDTHV